MLLIDAYNVLWLGNATEPHGPDLTASGLLRLTAHSRYRRRHIRLVCDGAPPPGEGVPSPLYGDRAMILRLGPGEIVYSGRSGSADDVIECIIRDHAAPRELLVVSSDRRVKRAAGRRRARTMTSEMFLAQILADRTRAPLPTLPAFIQEIPLNAHAVDLWRREFGLSPESDAALVRELAPPPIDIRSINPAPPALRQPSSAPRAPERPPSPSPHDRTSPTPTAPLDPELTRLMQEWGLRFDLDDLDMERWLGPNPDIPTREPPE